MNNLKVKINRKNSSNDGNSRGVLKNDMIDSSRINEGISSEFIQVISDDGENLGKMSRKEALEFAISRNLDLVVVLDTGQLEVPVAKIMNYSKKLYENKKKLNAAKKKKLESNQIKELRISPKISNHDLQIKMNQGVKFLKDGSRLKVVLIMKGRERGLKDTLGVEVFSKAEVMLSLSAEETGKHLVVDTDSDTLGSVCKTFYLKK